MFVFLDFKPYRYGSATASWLCPRCALSQRDIAMLVILLYQNLKKKKKKKVLSLTFSLAPVSFYSSLYLATQFFWIRQTTHGILCIGSSWQALKALTNDSLIQRKTEGGEGEADKKIMGCLSCEVHANWLSFWVEGKVSWRWKNNQFQDGHCKTVQKEENWENKCWRNLTVKPLGIFSKCCNILNHGRECGKYSATLALHCLINRKLKTDPYRCIKE